MMLLTTMLSFTAEPESDERMTVRLTSLNMQKPEWKRLVSNQMR